VVAIDLLNAGMNCDRHSKPFGSDLAVYVHKVAD